MSRMLFIGDGIALSTGFAQVLRQLTEEAVQRGHQVAQIACLDMPPTCDARTYHDRGVRPYFPDSTDPLAWEFFNFIQGDFKPDVIIYNGDAGTIRGWLNRHKAYNVTTPTVAYMPVEGSPVNSGIASVFRDITRPFTYTKWSSEALRYQYALQVPWVYHGVETDMFRPLSEHLRHQLRREWGWEDKFVVSYVGRNSWRKSHDRLIKALAYLKNSEGEGVGAHEDVLLYLHCSPFDYNWANGWDLKYLADCADVAGQVQFREMGDGTHGSSEDLLSLRLACSDLYIHPAKVEGFGLPILEAMACGVPVCVTNDHGNMIEVMGDAGLCILPTSDLDTWHNGAELFNVAGSTIAQVIDQAKRNPEALAKVGALGLARAHSDQFRWAHARTQIIDAAEELADEELAADKLIAQLQESASAATTRV